MLRITEVSVTGVAQHPLTAFQAAEVKALLARPDTIQGVERELAMLRLRAAVHEIGLERARSQTAADRVLEPGVELPMSAVAEQLYCDASNVTGMVDRLEARHLLERRDDPRDRRVKLIALTDEGSNLRERVLARLHEPPEAIARLSRADQRALRDLLRSATGG